MLRNTLIATALLLLSFNTYACDDKPCEKAYVSAQKQYAENDFRRAQAYRLERFAYAKVRAKRDYALVLRLHLLQAGRNKHKKG